jgi:multidrug efflux pump subunit AcrA (membrane-fusion protein)
VKKYSIGILVAVIIVIGYMVVNAIFTKSYDIPTVAAATGPLRITQQATGTVDASQAFIISAPPIRGLQITWMAPEGSMVKAHDTVIRFDATEQLTELTDYQSNLKINQTTLERARQEYTIQKKNLELELQRAERKNDEQKYEAPRLAEEARRNWKFSGRATKWRPRNANWINLRSRRLSPAWWSTSKSGKAASRPRSRRAIRRFRVRG